MLATMSQRLLQFKRIAAFTDLGGDAEKILHYAASLARWYEAELLLVHAYPPEFYAPILPGPLAGWPTDALAPRQEAEKKVKSLVDKLDLRDLAPKAMIRQESIDDILKELEEFHPGLLVMGTHGREGIRKWLAGSVAEQVFRKVQWPVLVLGPNLQEPDEVPQRPFERVLYGTDLSGMSVTALQHAATIARDHEAQLTVLYVEADPTRGFTFDQVMAQQRLQDWLQDHIDGLAETLVGVDCIIDFGKPQMKIVEAATQLEADLVVVGAHGLGNVAGPASHLLGGTAYEVVCSSKCPVLVVPHPR